MNSFIQTFIGLPLIISVMLKITIILTFGWIAHFLLARYNPRWRVLLWRCIIVGIFLVPALMPLKYLQIRIAPSPEPHETTITYPAYEPDYTFSSSEIPVESTYVSEPVEYANFNAPRNSFSFMVWLRDNFWIVMFLIWVIFAVILTSRLLVGFIRIKKKICFSLSAPENLQRLLDKVAGDLNCRRKIRLKFSPDSTTPFLADFYKPVIVLPEKMTSEKYTDEIPAILAHEVAHLCSGDLFWMFVARCMGILLWFHPLVWKLRDSHNAACEEVCDAIAAGYIKNAEVYSSALARVALDVMGTISAVGAVPMIRSSNILKRMRTLKRKVYSSPPARRWVILSVLAVMTVFVCIGSVKLAFAEQDTSLSVDDPNSQSDSREPYTVRGFVTDTLGRPRGNVYITPEGINIWDGKRSDLQGNFVLENVEPEQKKWVAYSQASGIIGLFTIPDNYDGKPIHVTLDYIEASIEGRVVGEQGRGLRGQSVELLITTKDGSTHVFTSSQRTDLNGNYEFGLLPFGSGLKIHARLKTTRDEWKKYITETVEIPENQIFIQMPSLVIGESKPEESDDGNVLVSGQILNEDGKPVPGAKIGLYFDMPEYMSTWVKDVMTDNSGRWQRRIPKDYSGLSITLTHPEYIKQSWLQFSREELRNGTNKITMKRGLQLKGIVKNQNGEPLENAIVDTGGGEGWTPYGEVMENHTTPRTLSDGSFSVGGLASETMDIVVSAFGYAPKNVTLDIVKNMKPIEVFLDKGKTYTGKVVDANDNPIEAVRVELNEWRIGNARHSLINLTQTDANGIFRMENLPDSGTIRLYYAKSKSGLMGFRKDLPEDFPEIDKAIMYKIPVFSGKIIDAETEKPITRFSLTSGIKSTTNDKPIRWNKYYKEELRSADGSFSKTWSGYAISYPFDNICQLRIEAEDYLTEIAPPMKLGEEYKPVVIRLTKGTPFTGTIIDSEGKTVTGAEVGWIGPDSKAFINNGKFSQAGYAEQTEHINKTGPDGKFKLPPSKDEGLILAVHEKGYASINTSKFENGSQIKLNPWAKIEGTIISSDENRKEYTVLINSAISDEELSAQKIRWMYNDTSFSQKNFSIDYIPSEPIYICQYIDSERMKQEYLEPQSGETYQVQVSDEPGTITGRILSPASLVGKSLPNFENIEIDFSLEESKGKRLLICFWDMEQRPSRNLVRELAKREKELEAKDLIVLLIHTSEITADELSKWIDDNNIPFTSGRITNDFEKVLFHWGVRSQPWLVLADENGQVQAGGFELRQLDEKIKEQQEGQISETILLRLVDSNGLPVSGAEVGTNVETRDEMVLGRNLSWSLRGHVNMLSDEWGEIKLSRERLFPSYWAEGRKAALYILHERRKIGAVCEILSANDKRNIIDLTLVPVCHVHGKLDSEGLKKVKRPLTWTNVYLNWDRDSHGVMSHMSEEQRFEFFVPPGEYEMNAYGSGGDGSDPARTSASTKEKSLKIEVKENQQELDFGTIDLPPTKIASLIGKPAPEIGPIQAWKNGSPVKLSQLRGKVVILYFDGESPNTSRDFPPLVELYEEFHDHGLEIIALYNCESMEQLEQNWIENYERFGGESEAPFLIAVDSGESGFYEGTDKVRLGATYNTYDITGIPTTILIDTKGNIVGDLNLYYASETVQKMLGVKLEPELAGWRQRFNKVYFLEEGQVLKRIAPPFIPERIDYYKEEESTQYSYIENPPDFFTFHWDGELRKWGMGFGSGKRPLKSVLNNNLSLNQNSYESLEELLEIDVPGDWIVLKDASEEQKLKALEEILESELGKKIRFEKRQVEREAIVATGSFEYHRLPVANEDRWILMFSDGFDEDDGAGGGTADSVQEFLEAIGNRVDVPVIDETEPPSEVVIPYRHYNSAYLSRIEDPAEKSEKLTMLLDNISSQTNLQFKVEQRPVEKWFVVESK